MTDAMTKFMIRLSVNVNKVATLRNSRGGRVPRRHRSRRGVPRGRRSRHHRASARRPASHHARRRARHRAALAGASRARRVQHRRRSAARTDRAGRRGAPGSVHARAGRRRRDHQPGRLAARAADGRTADVVAPVQVPRRSRQPVRRSRAGADRVGGFGRRRSRRALHRAVRPGVRAGAAAGRASFESYAAAARLATSLGLGRQRRPRSRPGQPRRCSARLPFLDEVSIGHAIISRALFVGLDTVVREYLDVLSAA